MTDVKHTDHLVFGFDNTFSDALAELGMAWQPAGAPAPEVLALNVALAAELGLDADALRGAAGIAVLSGNAMPTGAASIAQVYAGHQFGGYSPRLGDGRALLLGEVLDTNGNRRDLHLKGSGRTPFARGGDGKAAVGPMLREYLIGEAMHALGVPTTRALAVVATGEQVVRERMLPGAVLTRVAASHLRVGTFQYAAATGDVDLLARLAHYAIARHHPLAKESENPPLALLEAVIESQSALIAKWMLVGFVHGVMNTDNMTISGETIDYGPCAFMDRHDPATVFSSIDQHGRYAYGNQPRIALWNLARLAEALLPLVHDDTEASVALVTERLHTFLPRYEHHWHEGMRSKLGLAEAHADDKELFADLLITMTSAGLDHTLTFRSLSAVLRGADPLPSLAEWVVRWRSRLDFEGREHDLVAAEMEAVNPIYIPRNHIVEAALSAATEGDMTRFDQLVDVVTHPYAERPGLEEFALPAPAGSGQYVTFCGT